MAATPRPAPHLPNELYREIARNLHERRDKDALLSLALVNTAWRHESQRMLFSSLSDKGEDASDHHKLTHILFLESIIAHPDRLGPYVNLYAQHHMAYNAVTINTVGGWVDDGVSEHAGYRQGVWIWDLTSRALPSMINLKHLCMQALVSGGRMARDFLLGCQFQLETLIWRCDEDSTEELIAFLRTQRVLTHLEVGEGPHEVQGNLSCFTADVCPNLTSAGFNMDSVSFLACRKDIVALTVDLHDDVEYAEELPACFPSILARIKCLSVWNYACFSSYQWPIARNVRLLEIQLCDVEILRSRSIRAFPNLRVLALLDGDTILDDPDLLVEVPTLSFSQLPKLETIFIRPCHVNKEKPFGHYTKISLSRADPDAILEVGWVLSNSQLSLQWWRVYDTML